MTVIPNGQLANTKSAKADNYDICFCKPNGHTIGDFYTNITCSFDVIFNGQDSIVLSFGGNLKEFSVCDLKVNPSNIHYCFDANNRTLTIHKKSTDTSRISLSYGYCNLMAAIIAGNEKESELWDITYSSSAEYFYPFIPGDSINYSISYKSKKKIGHVSSCPPSGNVNVPICFVWFNSKQYQYYEGDFCRIYQFKEQMASSERVDQLSAICKQSLEFYKSTFGDDYAQKNLGTEDKPLFFFHTANDTWNRYNNGYILASQRKFATYDNILPLVHEIGHRWIGEFSFPLKEELGYSFIIESINEFMVWLFVQKEYGMDEYKKLLDKNKSLLENDMAARDDGTSLLQQRKNTDYTLAYVYGPLLLHNYSILFGVDKIIAIIVDFYQNYRYDSSVNIDIFFSIMKNHIGEEATERFKREMATPIFNKKNARSNDE